MRKNRRIYSRGMRSRSRSRITLKNHRHKVSPMKGFTSIPVRFRGRRF